MHKTNISLMQIWIVGPCSPCLRILDMVAHPLQFSVFYSPIQCMLCTNAAEDMCKCCENYAPILRKELGMLWRFTTNTIMAMHQYCLGYAPLRSCYDQRLCNLSSKAAKDMHLPLLH